MRQSGDGFSLIELLSVVAVLSIIVAFVVVAFSGIGRSQRVSEAISAIDDAFLQSFHIARSKGMPVWLAVTTENPGTTNERIRIRKYTTKNGELSGSSSTNLMQLSRDHVIQQVKLVERGGVALKDAIGNAPDLPQLPLNEEGGWIFISPGGEVRATAGHPDFDEVPTFPSGSMLRNVEIGVSLSGGVSEQISVVQFSGLTGSSRIFKP